MPNFCLGPPEISKLWTLVAQISLSGISNFGLLSCWATTLILGLSSTVSQFSSIDSGY